MKLFCPTCGGPIPAADMDLRSLAAKCRTCNVVFTFERPLREEVRKRSSDRPSSNRAAPDQLQPDRMRTEEWAGTWTARWRWLQWSVIPTAIFCVAWDSFLVFWYVTALRSHGPWLTIVFPVGHVAVGVGATYSVLAGFFNTTTVRADGQCLDIRHGPLPWRGNARIPAGEIRQLFCQCHTGNKRPTTYQLCAVLDSGRKPVLLRGFTNPDEPRYLEQQLGRRLRIAQALVAGEWRE